MINDANSSLLEIAGLSLQYRAAKGPIPILHNVSVRVEKGQILGVIGESGAGKSTLGNAIIGMLGSEFERTSGSIKFSGQLLDTIGARGNDNIRGRRISAIFQDHTASLDPLMSVGAQLDETIKVSNVGLSSYQIRSRGIEILKRVDISEPDRRYDDYPHQFSGGQRQRIVIAIAIAGSPEIIVADEPTSALDATVQKQILTLLRSLVRETGVAIILVTHDMGVIAEIADRVLVMRHGRIVEQNETSAILAAPQDEYTRKLLAAVPRLHISSKEIEAVTDSAQSPTASPNDQLATSQSNILVASDISKTFRASELPWPFPKKTPLRALDNVSIKVQRGAITGIVGESGSGKTTVGRIIAGLETAGSGEIVIGDTRFDVSRKGRVSGLLGRIQMVFQDPSVSLNPRMTIGETLQEGVRFGVGARAHTGIPDVDQMMDRLGLARSFLSRYPHQLSGGQKQRACIARALLTRPQIIVADEPTSALDVSVQAEIIGLLKERVCEDGVSMIFISHDLAVVQDLCSQVYIFKDGRVEDFGPSSTIFSNSQNAYTRSLVNARSQRFIH